MYLNIVTCIAVVVALVLCVIILVKVNKKGVCGEKYSFLFPEPDRRVLKGSIDCAYALNGGNTAYCNDWLKSYRAGKICQTDDGCHPGSMGKICCENALKCCNQVATCGGGQDCRDPKYTPTKSNKLMYDQDIYMDQ